MHRPRAPLLFMRQCLILSVIMKLLSEDDKKKLLERFIKYVKIHTTSDVKAADSDIQPSTERQRDLAKLLAEEMKEIGLQSVQITEHCYVYGFLPASEGSNRLQAFCLMAHMDTAGDVSGENVKPNIITGYDGTPVKLKCNITLDPATDKALALAAKEKDTVITTDGTTLLGADDKAGIAEIMTALSFLAKNKDIKHGKIEVLFSPDEETGHGMDNVPLKLLSSKRAYTVDGGHIGEIEDECFTAYKSDVTFTGHSVHTGTAREGGLVNAVTMAANFVASLPRHEAPETTDSFQGFYAPLEITSSVERSYVLLLLRDFTDEGIERRKNFVTDLANITAAAFGGKAETVHTKQYLNMKKKLDEHPEVMADLYKAYEKAGISPVKKPIRGGTDGSRLTEMGIPTPNIFTGGHNYHSRNEWASLSQMTAAAEVLIHLASIIGEN